MKKCEDCVHYYVDVSFPWCTHPRSDTRGGLRTTYQMRYPDGPCLPQGSLYEERGK